MAEIRDIKYSIFDPSGNITALVETRIDIKSQPEAADEIMKAHPEVEQVGFVYFDPIRPVPVYLRMAGGEFCGNATMSAAALYLIRSGEENEKVRVRVTGVSHSLEVRLQKLADEPDSFDAGVQMPAPLAIERIKLTADGITEELPVVKMEGITHIIIEGDTFSPKTSERAIRNWCEELGSECLGLMFIEESKDDIILTPLVYVPGADTIFWESSCASGSAACGMYLADREGSKVDISLQEPGGVLRVVSDPASKETWLYGRVRKR